MIIETEFSINQLVWFMHDNKAVFGKVEGIKVNVYINDEDELDIRISYVVRSDHKSGVYDELKLFQDKHALLSSL